MSPRAPARGSAGGHAARAPAGPQHRDGVRRLAFPLRRREDHPLALVRDHAADRPVRVVAAAGEQLQPRPVRGHRVEVAQEAVLVRGVDAEHEAIAPRRPRRVVPPRARHGMKVAPVRVHQPELRLEMVQHGERHPRAVRRPGRAVRVAARARSERTGWAGGGQRPHAGATRAPHPDRGGVRAGDLAGDGDQAVAPRERRRSRRGQEDREHDRKQQRASPHALQTRGTDRSYGA